MARVGKLELTHLPRRALAEAVEGQGYLQKLARAMPFGVSSLETGPPGDAWQPIR